MALRRFPESFFWGAASASHQVEGGNRWNDWWQAEQEGRLPFRSGDACDHYARYEQDFTMAASWGHNAHRLSIEWSRLEPEEGEWNEGSFRHYAKVIGALRERNLEPFVTLHHFTNPHWFAKRGGWLHADAAATFARFAARAARALPSVRYWITINEPTVYVKNGYTAGTWPPFRRGAWSAAASVLMNMARAHVEAYHALHAALSGVQVGFAHSAPYVEPCAFGGMPARIAARSRDFLLNDCFFLLLKLAARRRRIRQILDFIGINYYTRTRVHRDRGFAGLVFGKECREAHHSDRGADNELGWEIYPPGLAKIVCRFASHGLPIFVTENGIATSNDEQRAQFIVDHLRVLAEACESGVDLRGYFHWTLTDNYEWSHGTTAHFGLAGVEPETFARVPRRSALLYAEICRTNGATLREQEGP